MAPRSRTAATACPAAPCQNDYDRFTEIADAASQLVRLRATARDPSADTSGAAAGNLHRTASVIDLNNDCLSLVCAQLVAGGILPTVPGPASPSRPVRSFSCCGIPTAGGLQDAARLGLTCRRLHTVYTELLAQRPELAVQVEANARALQAHKRLVRRVTLEVQGRHLRMEVTLELVVGASVAGALLFTCVMHAPACPHVAAPLRFVAFSVTHVLAHTLMLGLAHQAAERLGPCCAARLGLAVILACGAVLLGLSHAVGADHCWPLGRGVWPTLQAGWQYAPSLARGQTLFVHVVSAAFTWLFGVWEFWSHVNRLKSQNGFLLG